MPLHHGGSLNLDLSRQGRNFENPSSLSFVPAGDHYHLIVFPDFCSFRAAHGA
jgi:hypothetical protein